MSAYTVKSNLQLLPPVVADFNGDGRLDLAAPFIYPDGVRVLLGNGNKTFEEVITLLMGIDVHPISMAVGDFNNDIKVDLAITLFEPAYVGVLLGNGNGTFGTPTLFSIGNYSFPKGIVVAEFNGDGYLDIAVANYYTSNIGVLLGNGNGTFAAPTTFWTGLSSFPTSVAVGDFDGDDYLDITFVNQISRQVGVLLGHGNGIFEARKMFSISVGADPYSIAVGHFNGDRHLDVVFSYKRRNAVSVLYGYGNGTFSPIEKFFFPAVVSSMAVGDFNNDGYFDIAVGFSKPYSINMLFGYKNGIFGAQPIFSIENKLSIGIDVAVGNFNDDGYEDIVITNQHDNTIDILWNTCECCAHEIL